MATKTGKVTNVYVKEFDDGKSVSFRVAGDEKFYRCGKKRFEGILEKGNTVEFEYSSINDSAAKLVGTPKLASAKAAGGGGSSSGNSSTSNDIHYQSSRKDAVEFLKAVLSVGAIKLPAKESGKLEGLEKALDHYTAAFYADVETKGAVARVKGPKPADEDAEGDEADDADDEGDDE